jgi:hypothetical protein
LELAEILGTKKIIPGTGYLKMVIAGFPKTGKCHGKNVPILMFDGTIKMVQDILPGDILMGPDSCARKVLSITQGRDILYRITPTRGESFTCNGNHILSLRAMMSKRKIYLKGECKEISINDYLKESDNFQKIMKLWKTDVEFPEQPLNIDPYMLGLWLADGTIGIPQITKSRTDMPICDYMMDWASRNGFICREEKSNTSINWRFVHKRSGGEVPNEFLNETRSCLVAGERRIPKQYLINSKANRQKLLAALLDTDGYLMKNNTGTPVGYEIITKYPGLAEDIKFLGRSLGFDVRSSKKIGTIKSLNFTGEYVRLTIFGNLDTLPMLLDRKRYPKKDSQKNWKNASFTIEEIGEDDYYGFMLDGDGLYLLGDFTVTHNSYLAGTAEHDPRLAPALFITQEFGGDQGLETLPEPRPEVLYCDSLLETKEAFWKIAQAIKQGNCPYKTIIFDTYSEAHAGIVRERGRQRAKITDPDSTQSYTISQDEYTNANKEMRELVERFKKLPLNLIVTCHTKVEEKRVGDRVVSAKTVFAVSEGSREPLERGFNAIGCLEFKKLWLFDHNGKLSLEDKAKTP